MSDKWFNPGFECRYIPAADRYLILFTARPAPDEGQQAFLIEVDQPGLEALQATLKSQLVGNAPAG